MKRRLSAVLVGPALLLAFASSAMGATTLGFSEVKHEPAAVNRGDEHLVYVAKLKNTGGEPTAGTTTVSVDLPSGVKFASATGTGWTCQIALASCQSAGVIAPSGPFPTLTIVAWIDPAVAPGTIVATFTATGGGSVGSWQATDSVTQGPENPFQIENLSARAEDEAGADYTEAGGHPFSATSSFEVPTHTDSIGGKAPMRNLRDLIFDLPAGFVVNPESVAKECTVAEVSKNLCPESAAVGGVDLDLETIPPAPIYRIIAEDGFPAAFAFRPVFQSPLTYVLRGKVRTNGRYTATAVAPLPPQNPPGANFIQLKFATLCGYGAKVVSNAQLLEFGGCKTPEQTGSNEIPLLTNPTNCSEVPVTRASMDSFQEPGAFDAEGFPLLSDPNWKSDEATSPISTGCPALTESWVGGGPSPTEPSFEFQSDSGVAAAPAGYHAELEIPQDGLLTAQGRGTSHLRDTVVTLPRGIALNPAAADGLAACSEADIGLVSKSPLRFNTTAPGCPNASKLGDVKVVTPLLDKPLRGSVYLAAQEANPFGSKFAIYLVVDDAETGVVVKLAGRVDPSNDREGQITTTFADNPQLPFEDFDLQFYGGSRASLANPDVCGSYVTETRLTPWSAADPANPTAAETVFSADTTTVDTGAGGAACPTTKAQRPFDLGFEAGVTDPVAGSHSPFTLRLTRGAGNQELDRVQVTTPPGFVATLSGVGTCSEAAIAAAAARKGRVELDSPSCPAKSQVGTTTIGVGAGSSLYYVKTGRIYRAGPYKGAPLSLAFIVPAVAGPFDLGVQVVRVPIEVDPKTAQITATSDAIPQILEGVPLQIRDVRVDLDRRNFTLNPTSCERMAIMAEVTGASGAMAKPSSHFQVGGCDRLGFRPNLKLQLHGGTKRTAYQRLEATVTARAGDANFARAAVTLPHSAFLAQEHIRTVCTRVQFAANSCPPGSIYGHATAITPLLDEPLQGPVYLRSSNNELPDLVAALRGPDSLPLEVELSGRTDSVHGGIRNTFDIVPDAPVTKFKLELMGGDRSLIVNSRDLCKGPKQRATVRFSAQNGKVRNFRPVVGNDCGKNKHRKAKRGHRRR